MILRSAAFANKIHCPPHDNSPVLLALDSLANRRHAAHLSFLTKVLTNKVDCASLLSLINFK